MVSRVILLRSVLLRHTFFDEGVCFLAQTESQFNHILSKVLVAASFVNLGRHMKPF